MNILFLQPSRQLRDLGVNLERLRHVARFGVIRPDSLSRRLGDVGVVVNCIDTSVVARNILELAASRGVPRLYLFDGIYDTANAYRNPAHLRVRLRQMDPMLYTHIACVDRWSYEALAALGVRTHAWLPTRAAPDESGDPPPKRTAAFLIATARTPAFDEGERD